jgi:hypothetical protein
MATCTNCKAELTEGYDFCLACGMPVPTDAAVPNLDDDAQPEVRPPLPPQGATTAPEPPPFIPPPPPAGQDAPAVFAVGGMPASEERTWTIAAHISAFVGLVGIPPLIGPLVIWLMKKDLSPVVDAHGKEAVNFNLSFLLYGIVSALLIFVLIGFLLVPIVLIGWFVLVIVATMKVSNGEPYRYPLTIRFIK